MPSLAKMKAVCAKNKEERKAQQPVKKDFPAAIAKEVKSDPVLAKVASKAATRLCCPTPRGQGEHSADCISRRPKADKPPKKPKSPREFDDHDGKAGRWPDNTVLHLEWTGTEWTGFVDGKNLDAAFYIKGTGIHKLISKAFRDWMDGKHLCKGDDV